MSLVHNERTKLAATWPNSLGAVTVATGVIAPIIAVVFGIATFRAITPVSFALATVAWFVLGIDLHILGTLRE
jgi:hypothetical protein